MSAPTSTPRRFTFDTVFDGDRVIAPQAPKRHFSLDELEAARAEGFAQGQRAVVAQAEAQMAQALRETAAAMRAAFTHLAGIAHTHRTDSARLALACARRIADAALDRFPEQPAVAALEALSRELDAQPRLLVRANIADVERLRTALEQASESIGFPGLVVVKAEPGQPRAGFSFNWGEGRAAFDPVAAGERVAQALETALAAEGLHAEPLVPPAEASP